jgi:hypothetical protein
MEGVESATTNMKKIIGPNVTIATFIKQLRLCCGLFLIAAVAILEIFALSIHG